MWLVSQYVVSLRWHIFLHFKIKTKTLSDSISSHEYLAIFIYFSCKFNMFFYWSNYIAAAAILYLYRYIMLKLYLYFFLRIYMEVICTRHVFAIEIIFWFRLKLHIEINLICNLSETRSHIWTKLLLFLPLYFYVELFSVKTISRIFSYAADNKRLSVKINWNKNAYFLSEKICSSKSSYEYLTLFLLIPLKYRGKRLNFRCITGSKSNVSTFPLTCMPCCVHIFKMRWGY